MTVCTLRNAQPMYAATYFPATDTLISAEKGKGCFVGNPERRSLLSYIPWHGNLDKTQIATDVGSWTLRHDTFDQILRPLAEHFNILSSMSAVESGRKVLYGEVGVYYNLGIAKIWDAAAMALCIQEAGGFVCDHQGNPMKWDKIPCDWIMAGSQSLANIVIQKTKNWKGREK